MTSGDYIAIAIVVGVFTLWLKRQLRDIFER